jgi:ribosomal protein S7
MNRDIFFRGFFEKDPLVSHFIQNLIKRGKKERSINLVIWVLRRLKKSLVVNPVLLLKSVILRYNHFYQIVKIKKGKKIFYHIRYLSFDRQLKKCTKHFLRVVSSIKKKFKFSTRMSLLVALINHGVHVHRSEVNVDRNRKKKQEYGKSGKSGKSGNSGNSGNSGKSQRIIGEGEEVLSQKENKKRNLIYKGYQSINSSNKGNRYIYKNKNRTGKKQIRTKYTFKQKGRYILFLYKKWEGVHQFFLEKKSFFIQLLRLYIRLFYMVESLYNRFSFLMNQLSIKHTNKKSINFFLIHIQWIFLRVFERISVFRCVFQHFIKIGLFLSRAGKFFFSRKMKFLHFRKKLKSIRNIQAKRFFRFEEKQFSFYGKRVRSIINYRLFSRVKREKDRVLRLHPMYHIKHRHRVLFFRRSKFGITKR